VDLFLFFFFVLPSKRQHPKAQANGLKEEHAKQELCEKGTYMLVMCEEARRNNELSRIH
jgi:hypothetical protein